MSFQKKKRRLGEISSATPTTPQRTIKEKKVLISWYNYMIDTGVKKTKIFEIFNSYGEPVSERSLYRWRAQMKDKGLVSLVSNSGRRATLDKKEIAIVIGFILQKNFDRCEVTYADVSEFIKAHFKKTLTISSVSNYCKRNGITIRLAKSKKSSNRVSVDIVKLYQTFLRELPRHVRFGSTVFGSIDFTYKSHRNGRQTTLAPVGSPQPCVSRPLSAYTNCLMTVVYSDGSQSPSMCFTFNKKFVRKAGRSVAARKHNEALKLLYKDYDIDGRRIFLIPQEHSNSKKFVREAGWMVPQMLNNYQIRCRDFHTDNGAALFPKGKSAVTPLGFNHFTSPPAIHQYVSPNDNSLHGVAKRLWRTERRDFSNDVESTLHLMHLLDSKSSKSIKSCTRKK